MKGFDIQCYSVADMLLLYIEKLFRKGLFHLLLHISEEVWKRFIEKQFLPTELESGIGEAATFL